MSSHTPKHVAAAAEAMLDATLNWDAWCFRRVDSIEPLDDERGHRRYSVDCTPPPDPRLAYEPGERRHKKITKVNGRVMLPLAYIEKGPLRRFDARTGEGGSLPVLGMSESIPIVVAMMERMLRVDGVTFTSHTLPALREIAGPATSSADRTEVLQFLATGRWRGTVAWAGSRPPSQLTSAAIQTTAQRFLLIALIDARYVGTRQLIKYSHAWYVENSWKSRLTAPLVAAGWGPRILEVVPHMADAAASYHLELVVPRELRCTKVLLPPPESAPDVHGYVDTAAQPVAHAFLSYTSAPAGPAEVHLSVPARGMWLTALLITGLTAVLVGLMRFLPYAKETWVNSPDSASALLIAAAALLVGYLAAGREHSLVLSALNFLRSLLLLSMLSLLLVATSIVGQLHQPYLDWLWAALLLLNAAAAGFLLLPRLMSKVQSMIGFVTRWVQRENNGAGQHD
ncbi:hypothetical protein [Microbacterium sp. SORGH_AS_0862]|uniref:hypothetical protein n=1 Tax=Microbacterium sp. SORGH_AS_0862 TaxID=3041789 RepID=UPI00278EFFF8|nr:hypothetical protein [Microbacterium sp. SORGH_AS_0862]MDQ1204371.1 hypothetical protein [Microbacterium sp. SORGH_AS_0862]